MNKIITWNINGIKSTFKSGNLETLWNQNADIYCLQEIKIKDEKEILNIIPKNYTALINKAEKNGYSGTAIIHKIKAQAEKILLSNQRFNEEGRIIKVELADYELYNVYLPHGGRDKSNLKYKLDVANEIIKILNEQIKLGKKIIVATDFNIAHNDIDLARAKQNRNNIMFTEEERRIIDKLQEIGMVDSFREFNNRPEYYTWWPYAFDARNRNLGWRIDYFFVSKNLIPNVKSVRILKDIYGSDHCPSEIIV